MKRCPQCEFVYEDEQNVCDMDGSELAHEELSLPLPPLIEMSGPPAVEPAKRARRSFVVPAFAGIILAALSFVAYYATTQGLRRPTVNASQETVVAASQPAQNVEAPTPVQADETEPLPEETDASATVQPKPNVPGRLSPGPVSAAAPAERGQGSVLIRLANGATIKADDAWQKREGIWYRQAGVVTFLKRSQVRAIERPARSHTATPNVTAPKPAPVSAEPKKDSRVKSILKTTGRFLKKPFKL